MQTDLTTTTTDTIAFRCTPGLAKFIRDKAYSERKTISQVVRSFILQAVAEGEYLIEEP